MAQTESAYCAVRAGPSNNSRFLFKELNTVIKYLTLAAGYQTEERGPRTTANWNSGLGEVMMRVVR